jgi:general secretion pathway protein L
MAKRFIGIDLEGTEARVAILSATPGRINVELDKRSYESPEQAAEAIREMLGGDIALGDRLVTALPCRVGLFRRVRFPFRDKGKIEATLPLELGSRLPVPLEEHIISFLPARAREKDYEIDAVVINRLEVDDLLTHFPDPQQNPRRIDYFPFALLPALDEQEGVLIYCRRLEVVVTLIYDGKVWDYRLLPGTSESAEEDILDFISNQICQLENAIGQTDLPLWVLGAGVTEHLFGALKNTGRRILTPAEDVFGKELSMEMAPAALLALGELRTRKKDVLLNFRKGDFAAKGQLEIFRTKLVIAAVMLLLVLVGTAVTMHLGYLQKKRTEDSYKQQLKQLFTQTMPPNTPLVDAPLQIESHLKELQKQVQLFGLGGHGAAAVLQAMSSHIDPKIRVDLDEFTYSSDEVKVDGSTDSFDSVNKITEVLGKNRLFKSVEISNAKLAADNSKVGFELQMKLAGSGGGK